jgi:hypothetical protein
MFAFLLLGGCSGMGGFEPVHYDPQQVSEAALKAYDTDGDGRIAGVELDQSPALKGALKRIDSNSDGAISGDEIKARFEAYQSQSQLVATSVLVMLDNKPLTDAKVVLEPEPFMGEALPSFSGTSDADDGTLVPRDANNELPGLPLGFYRVLISQPQRNVDATLGCEIADDAPSVNRMVFKLSSRK